MTENIIQALSQIRAKAPLIHYITNYVTVNDCANVCLAIGASPIMADDIDEMADIASISSCLVINIGTLNKRTVASMLIAALKANERGVPVVLDPVGAGASGLRNETLSTLLAKVRFSVIRGNLSEMRYLVENQANTKGVDVSDKDMTENPVEIARRCAKKFDCIAAITGKTDIITDGTRTLSVQNGHEMLSSVTGTGCMCTALIGAFCGANTDMLTAAAGGILCMGIAGETAQVTAGQKGLGSFHISLIDGIGNLTAQMIKERAKIYEDSY